MFLSSCTSVIALGTVYDSAAGRFSKELISYADFTNLQKKEIRHRVAAFQQWHRQDHLPQYRTLIEQITTTLKNPQSVAKGDVAGWVDSARRLTRELSHCSPLNGSGAFLADLSDRQTQQIEDTIRNKHIERVREYQSETAEQRLKKRRLTLEKWASRAGTKMNRAQQEVLKNTLSTQHSLSPQRHHLWQRWSDRLTDMLIKRDAESFESEINQHIHSLWNLTEKNYPDEWQANVMIWQNFLFEFVQLMTPDQAQRLTKKLNSISKTLDTLQNNTVKASARCFAITQ